MSEYKIINNFLLFQELYSDSIGVNYRAGVIDQETRKASKHVLLTDVYPFIGEKPDVWKRVNILMEGIRKSNIPNLYAPQDIVKDEEEGHTLLVYPHLRARPFEEILERSDKKDIPMNFELTFSMALAIADLIDTGSSIVVSGQKSFHGFLTPDNILIDNDGKIFLKNYGIFPYLSKNEELFNEMVNKYGAWVTPEFLRKESLVSQSDIYHLGYIIYRILTGEYFSYAPGEDFDAKFANISFTQHLPSSDKDFITNLINFFKKTLNPDISQRFHNIKEFKDYISHYFHIEELSSVTFNLAYFMNSLYSEEMEAQAGEQEKEMEYTIPEEVPEEVPVETGSSDLAADILAGLDEQKSSKSKLLIPIAAAALIIIAVVTFFFIQQSQTRKAAEEAAIKAKLESDKRMEAKLAEIRQENLQAQQKYQEELSKLQIKEADTESEKEAKQVEINKLKEWRADQERKEQEKIKQQEDELQRQKAAEEQKKITADLIEKKRLEELALKKALEEKKRKEEELNRVIPGQEVSIAEVDVKPVKIKGKPPILPPHLKRKYRGNAAASIQAMLRINETGQVTNVRILGGGVPDDVKEALKKGLLKWQYEPAKEKNVKVTVWMPVPVKVTF